MRVSGGAARVEGDKRGTSRHKSTVRRLTGRILPSRITKREILGAIARKNGMPSESNTPNAVEQAVSRALRDNLERIQRTSDELHEDIADVVAACGSSKPVNALPPMLRAQTSAASLAASLEVLSRFVTVSLQPGPRSPFESEIARIAGTLAAAEPAAVVQHPVAPVLVQADLRPAPVAHVPAQAAPPVVMERPAAQEPYQPVVQPRVTADLDPNGTAQIDGNIGAHGAEMHEVETAPAVLGESEDASAFDVGRLSAEEQELHRRANRVAKVSMQDIKMLRPEQVRLGRQHKDICVRLRDDIEKAHREYDRRFKPIMDHPVDYFYRWMVEILAEGDAHALGDYPYATTSQHR